MPEEQMHTTGEAAKLLGVSFRTIKRWIYSGKILVQKTPTGRYHIPSSEIDRLKELMRSKLEELEKIRCEALALVKRKKVAYQRELQICLEFNHLHEDTYEALDVLVENKELKTESFKGNRWYYAVDASWKDVEPIAVQKKDLIEFYMGWPRDFRQGDTLYDDYSEFLVERALIHAGYTVVSKNAYYFNGNSYRQAVGPGRPRDVDFIVYFHQKDTYLGIQIKNRLEYPRVEDIHQFVDICHTLHLKPVLVTRISHPRIYSLMKNVKGETVIFFRYFLKPEFPNDKWKSITEGLGIPIGVYRRVPDFLVQKFEGLKAEL
jgi:excisionase family DNA binding protein